MENGVLIPEKEEQQLIEEAKGPDSPRVYANTRKLTLTGMRVPVMSRSRPLVMGFEFKSLGLLKGQKGVKKAGVGCLRAYVPSK